MPLILVDSNDNWIDAIIHDVRYFECSDLDSGLVKGLVWGLIKCDDIDRFKRSYFPMGSRSRIQKNKQVKEKIVTDDDVLSKKWVIHGGFAISPLASNILNFYNKRLDSENILIYKNIYDDTCSKHRYYDIKKIKITRYIIECDVCKKLPDDYERRPFRYNEGIDYSNLCKCKIVNNEIISCPLCDHKQGIKMFRSKMCFGKYKGRYVIDIMRSDISYIKWVCENVKNNTKHINEICNKILITKN